MYPMHRRRQACSRRARHSPVSPPAVRQCGLVSVRRLASRQTSRPTDLPTYRQMQIAQSTRLVPSAIAAFSVRSVRLSLSLWTPRAPARAQALLSTQHTQSTQSHERQASAQAQGRARHALHLHTQRAHSTHIERAPLDRVLSVPSVFSVFSVFSVLSVRHKHTSQIIKEKSGVTQKKSRSSPGSSSSVQDQVYASSLLPPPSLHFCLFGHLFHSSLQYFPYIFWVSFFYSRYIPFDFSRLV